MTTQNLILCASFLATGCFNSVITQVIYNYAPINSKSMLLVFCAYLGYALRYFIRYGGHKEPAKKEDEERGKTRKRDKSKEKEKEKESENESSKLVYVYLFGMVVAEIGASQLSMIAFSLIGSGVSLKLHQVLYSSIIFFTALVSAFVLRKKIYPLQWGALLLLTIGLITSAGRVSASEVPIEGVVYLFTATFIFAITSSISEVIIQKYKIPSSQFSMFYGLYGSGLIGIYMVLVTSTHWEEWVMGPIMKSGEAGMAVVFLLMAILIAGQLVRGVVYFNCVSTLGSVSTGVLYALQAVCMFSLSAVLFCDATHPNQCFTGMKGLGTIVVAAGVALYSIGDKQKKIKT